MVLSHLQFSTAVGKANNFASNLSECAAEAFLNVRNCRLPFSSPSI